MPRTRRDPRLDLPPLELECMKALWALGEGTVHTIRARLLPARPLAYTTVMTIMDRLARKGAAARAKRSRAFLYRPLVTEEQVRELALERLVAEHFEGSREGLRSYVAGNPNSLERATRPDDRAQVRRSSARPAGAVPAPPADIDAALL